MTRQTSLPYRTKKVKFSTEMLRKLAGFLRILEYPGRDE